MAKKKKQKPIYNNITFDSKQQISFYKWCQLALQNQIIYDFIYHPKTFILSERQQYNGKFLLHPHKYTPDFLITLNQKYLQKMKKIFKHNVNQNQFYIDIKGAFNRHESHTKLSIQTKWVYQRYGILIHKVLIDKLFKQTFIPQQLKLTPVKKLQIEKYKECKLIKEF